MNNSSEKDFFETFWTNSSGGFEGSQTFFQTKNICSFISVSLHFLFQFPFHFLLISFHLLSSFLSSLFLSILIHIILPSCLASSLSSCLVFFCFGSQLLSLLHLVSPLPSSLLSLISVFSLCLSLSLSVSVSLSPCDVVCDAVLCCVCRCGRGVCLVCVCVCLVCGVSVCWGTLKKSGKTSMWIPTRLRVYIQNVPVYAGTTRT